MAYSAGAEVTRDARGARAGGYVHHSNSWDPKGWHRKRNPKWGHRGNRVESRGQITIKSTNVGINLNYAQDRCCSIVMPAIDPIKFGKIQERIIFLVERMNRSFELMIKLTRWYLPSLVVSEGGPLCLHHPSSTFLVFSQYHRFDIRTDISLNLYSPKPYVQVHITSIDSALVHLWNKELRLLFLVAVNE